jgi:hypothetical protein
MCACRSARLKQIAEARAQGVGSAYRSSSMGLALRFLRRLHGGACDRQEVSAQAGERATPHKPERTEGAGRRADRVRRTWRALQSGIHRAGRLAARPLQCDEANGVHSPFGVHSVGAGRVCGEHTHTPSRCAVRDGPAYGTCTCVYIYAHARALHVCAQLRDWPGWPGYSKPRPVRTRFP